MFYFVRHGETDYTERGTKIYQGHGTNLAPLSETGIGDKESGKGYSTSGGEPDFVFFLYKSRPVCRHSF